MLLITVNINAINRYKLRSIDSVYEWLSEKELKVLAISSERDVNSKNIHYHVLADNETDTLCIELWNDKIYNETVQNEYAYYEYMIKYGNYKLFNDYQPIVKSKATSQYAMMLDDIYVNNYGMDQIRIKYPTLYVRHYKTIINMIMGVFE